MRIAYVLLTCEKYINTRVPWQLETSLSQVPREDIYYMGHTMDEAKRIFYWGAGDDYHSLPVKMLHMFQNMSFDSYDWIFIADDDTYVITERLPALLAPYDPSQCVSMGKVLDHIKYEYFEYYSGGAGTILSIALFNKVQAHVRIRPFPIIHWCADICLGMWLIDVAATVSVPIQNNNDFHTEYYQPMVDSLETAITFHHLKEWHQYDELKSLLEALKNTPC